MKKFFKRSLAVVLVLIMIAGIVPVITPTASALDFTDYESALRIAKTGDEVVSILADFFIAERDWSTTGDVDFR